MKNLENLWQPLSNLEPLRTSENMWRFVRTCGIFGNSENLCEPFQTFEQLRERQCTSGSSREPPITRENPQELQKTSGSLRILPIYLFQGERLHSLARLEFRLQTGKLV